MSKLGLVVDYGAPFVSIPKNACPSFTEGLFTIRRRHLSLHPLVGGTRPINNVDFTSIDDLKQMTLIFTNIENFHKHRRPKTNDVDIDEMTEMMCTFTNIDDLELATATFTNVDDLELATATFTYVDDLELATATFTNIDDLGLATATFTNIDDLGLATATFTNVDDLQLATATFTNIERPKTNDVDVYRNERKRCACVLGHRQKDAHGEP